MPSGARLIALFAVLGIVDGFGHRRSPTSCLLSSNATPIRYSRARGCRPGMGAAPRRDDLIGFATAMATGPPATRRAIPLAALAGRGAIAAIAATASWRLWRALAAGCRTCRRRPCSTPTASSPGPLAIWS
jgi:hypothetical protein